MPVNVDKNAALIAVAEALEVLATAQNEENDVEGCYRTRGAADCYTAQTLSEEEAEEFYAERRAEVGSEYRCDWVGGWNSIR